jgi:DNA 3'-phosphatase
MSKIHKINNPLFSKKIAAFDFDHTLVKPKNNETFPRYIDDWEYLYSNIKEILEKLYENHYMIVIFTNQSKTWKEIQILNVVKDINIPITVVIAFSKDEYKPNKYIFEKFIKSFERNETDIDYKQSFFVGDALDASIHFSDSDKKFGENIGFTVKSPEEMFLVK